MPGAIPLPPDAPALDGAWWGGPTPAVNSSGAPVWRGILHGSDGGAPLAGTTPNPGPLDVNSAAASATFAGSTVNIDVAGLVAGALLGMIVLHVLGFRFATDVSVTRR